MTASFLPKPVVGVNGNGMHTNVSVSKDGKNLFWDPRARRSSASSAGISRPDPHPRERYLPDAELERQRIPPARPALRSAQPDQSVGGRPGSMVRFPSATSAVRASRSARSRRTQTRTWSCCPCSRRGSTAIAQTGKLRAAERFLPDNIYDALADFRKSDWTTSLLTAEVKERYADLKQGSADRCPRLLGTFVKAQEVQYHHEVYNQYLWNLF